MRTILSSDFMRHLCIVVLLFLHLSGSYGQKADVPADAATSWKTVSGARDPLRKDTLPVHIVGRWVKPGIADASGMKRLSPGDGPVMKSLSVQSTGITGDDWLNPIDAGQVKAHSSYTNTQNTNNFTNAFEGRPTKDVVYRFTVAQWTYVSISHCGSSVYDTYLTLLNGDGKEIAYNDNGYSCSSYTHAGLSVKLPAGTYYIVSEGYSINGSITTQIHGYETTAPLLGEYFHYPIDVGTFSSGFQFTDTQNTANFSDEYRGMWGNDVYYRFTITTQMEVTMHLCGSQSEDPWVWLLDERGNLLADQIDYMEGSPCELHSYIRMVLDPGTYYVVSEDYYEEGGVVVTNISGVSSILEGDNLQHPIDLGSYGAAFSYSDTRDFRAYNDTWNAESFATDVFYRFTLTRGLTVSVNHCGSPLRNTILALLDAAGKPLSGNYGQHGADGCPSKIYQGYARYDLMPGTYYVVSEAGHPYASDFITTNIRGMTLRGDDMQHPVVMGTYSDAFQYVDTRNSGQYSHTYGQSTADIVYQMTLTRPMEVEVTHCGSGLGDTYLSLSNEMGALLAANDNNSGCGSPLQAGLKTDLSEGVYYIVSEGKSQNGDLKLSVKGTIVHNEYGYHQDKAPDTGSSDMAPVGATPGTPGVSATGAATYTIPLVVPTGVGGLQPVLALTYSSQSGNGIAGWGCHLSGTSVITRVPKDIYHDGAAKGITYGQNDEYALDGQRLIRVSATAGVEGAVYHPETDPYTKVLVHGTYTAQACNVWFEVQTRDGMKQYYGSASGRQTFTSGSVSKTNAWYLDYVEDPLGNYMTYTYTIFDCFPYLTQIFYGRNKNETSALTNKIYFNYDSRPDPMPFYLENVKGGMNRRLASISCKTGYSILRAYTLAYTKSDHFSRLVSVSEKGSNNRESLKSTLLQWNYLPALVMDNSSPEVRYSGHIIQPFADQAYLSADMNGDGISDIIGVYPYTSAGGDKTTMAQVYLGKSDESGAIRFESGSVYNLGVRVNFEGWDRNMVNMPIDIDGNGINEMVLAILDDQAFAIRGIGVNFSHSYAMQNGHEKPLFATGDIDHNGRGDMIFMEKNHNSGRYPCGIISCNPNGTVKQQMYSLTVPQKPRHLFVADFNGNGMSDLMVVYSGGYTIFWNQGNGISDNSFSDSYKTAGTSIADHYMIRSGDFDGDGLPDFLMNETGSNQWYFGMNTGNGTFFKRLACTLEIYDHDFTSKDDSRFNCIVFDFNHDGKSDVVIQKAMYDRKDDMWSSPWGKFNRTYTHWMRSTGTTLVRAGGGSSGIESDGLSQYYITGDFDGDGRVELMNYGYNCYDGGPSGAWQIYRNPFLYRNSGTLSAIADGMDNRTDFEYVSLPTGNIYTKGEYSQYPVVDITPSLCVVKSVITDNGVAAPVRTDYKYGSARVHLEGKGFLGFGMTGVTNRITGISNEHWAGWPLHPTYYVPQKVTTITTGNDHVAESETSYTFINKGGKLYYSYPGKVIAKDFDNTETWTTTEYDPATGDKKFDKVDVAGYIETSIYSGYTLAGGARKPQLVVTNRQHSGMSDTDTDSTRIYYDSGKGYVVKKTDHDLTPQALTTEYGYDTFGNLTVSKVSGAGIPAVEYHNSYDVTKRFVASQYTVPASDVMNFEYDVWGNVLKETDATEPGNPLTTTHTYDQFGRRTSTTLPDLRKTGYSIGWSNLTPKRYWTLTQSAGQPWVKTWYDKSGRELSSETVGPKGLPAGTSNTYNNRGELVSKVERQGGISVTTEYKYDWRGRLTEEKSSAGQTTGYVYANTPGRQSVTRTVNGKQYTTVYDMWGGIVSSSDPQSGTVSYSYYPSGLPESVTAAGVTLKMTYDQAGNRTSLVDPNTGTYTYAYDALGRIRMQTGPQGVTASGYDALGRLEYTAADTDTIRYTYGTEGYQKNRLVRERTGNNYADYTYDRYGRTATVLYYIEGEKKPLSFSYTYLSNGQPGTTSYPEGVKVMYGYDDFGNLSRINAGQHPIWEQTGFSGTANTVKIGRAMTMTTRYDPSGRLTSQSTVKGSTSVTNFGYAFDATGNLSWRTGMIARKESFYYDPLDRLTEVKEGTPEALVMSVNYEPNGNIKNKTGLGRYDYHSTRSHAVETVENTGGLINTRGQRIGYNTFNKTEWVTDTVGNIACRLDITYGPDQQRWKTVLQKNGSTAKTVIFAGDYERVTRGDTVTHLYYMGGNGIYVNQVKGSTTLKRGVYHALTDHLGSLVVVTDAAGNIRQHCSFDAWGRRSFVIKDRSLIFDRGYTGHEHLDEFGLINMNGRMYDPLVGRFLSPDPYVQDPGFSQSFNRYSYCWNNPLIYTDPSGEIIAPGAAILITAMAYLSGVQANFWNAVQNNTNPFNPAGWNWGSPWTYTGMAAGAFMGYAQSLQHCEYMVDIHSGSKTFLSNAGDGKFHIYRHGEWIDNHTAFRHLYTTIDDVALGGVDNIQRLASRFYAGSAIAGAKMSAHERTMSNPLVRNMHAAQSRFWRMTGEFFDYLGNGKAPDVNSPYNLPQYHGGIVVVPGGISIRGGGLTNAQLVQKAATKAEAAIGGTGRFAGTNKHKYATDLLKRYQKIYGDKGLRFGESFNNGAGNRGILDVLDNHNGIIYDWKFGYPGMTPAQLNATPQMLKYRRNFGLPTQIIKP